MNPEDLAFTPALEQAELIRQKEISPIELVQLYLDRIERLNPQLGSFITVTADLALEDAKTKTELLLAIDQTAELPPFFGVPISIKDLNAVQGVRCTYGNAVLQDNITPYDDGVVARIKQAGFILLGKTATSELGSLPYTEPPGFPPARNPWQLNHTAGGSSGGAAAAVAAGLNSIAQGSDGGGSIRGPAACCGVVGIKPSRGRVSHAPVGDSLSGIAALGPIARTVTDAAALLDVMAGPIVGDPYWLPSPNPSFLQIAKQGSNASLRIAFSTGIPFIGEAESACQRAVVQTADLLTHLGHQLIPDCPDFQNLVEPFTVIWRSSVSASGLPPEALSPFNQWLLSHNDSSGTYLRAVGAMQAIARQIVAFFEHYDALLLPVYLYPPIQIGEWADLPPAEVLDRVIRWIAPLPPFNATGQPSIAIPAGFSPEGLPIGVQLIGRPADEATIIALAAQIEAAKPWSHFRPPIGRGV